MPDQGSANLILAYTDFRGRKMVLQACSCTQNYVCIKRVMLGANLHRLIYNLLVAIIFPTYFAIS